MLVECINTPSLISRTVPSRSQSRELAIEKGGADLCACLFNLFPTHTTPLRRGCKIAALSSAARQRPERPREDIMNITGASFWRLNSTSKKRTPSPKTVSRVAQDLGSLAAVKSQQWITARRAICMCEPRAFLLARGRGSAVQRRSSTRT